MIGCSFTKNFLCISEIQWDRYFKYNFLWNQLKHLKGNMAWMFLWLFSTQCIFFFWPVRNPRWPILGFSWIGPSRTIGVVVVPLGKSFGVFFTEIWNLKEPNCTWNHRWQPSQEIVEHKTICGKCFKVIWNAKIVIFSFLKISDICKD
jgi:hypothetical protein